jgi:hypothetical protein
MGGDQLRISLECETVRELRPDESSGSPVDAIVETVASLEGVDPGELPPLYESIDPDVLNTVARGRPSDSDAAVCFVYDGWNICVRGDGSLVVGDPEQTAEPIPLF